jgi:nucleotide-binding universal stress UspA family protein
MKNIMVLTDFGPVARHAIDYACQLCNDTQAENLYLLNTFESVPLYDAGEAGVLTINLQQTEETEESRRESHKQLKKDVAHQLQVTHIISLMASGDLADVVNEICKENNIDLVVIGVKSKEMLEEAFFGSHTYRAIEYIKSPVLVVPPQAAIQLPGNALLAADFDNLGSSTILQKLKSFLEIFKTQQLAAIHRVSAPQHIGHTHTQAKNLESYFKDHRCKVNFIDQSANLPNALNDHAQENDVSLIITIHKTRGFFSSLFHKSMTKQIAWHSTLPVLVFHVK